MRGVLFGTFAVCVLSLFVQGVWAQDAAPPAERQGRPPLGPPKNLKILRPEQIPSVMGAFMNWTGLKCSECHTVPDFASDEKPKKLVARRMLEMVRDINANTFGGEEKVTCYTCHRGEAHPLAIPPSHLPK